MIAGLNVITDNLDYLLWGRAATGEPGGVLLSVMMAVGAAVIALSVVGLLLAAATLLRGTEPVRSRTPEKARS